MLKHADREKFEAMIASNDMNDAFGIAASLHARIRGLI